MFGVDRLHAFDRCEFFRRQAEIRQLVIAYLEGDCDAALFFAHYELDGKELGETKLYERQAPCRNYPRYQGAQ
jgi:hypothetical protein